MEETVDVMGVFGMIRESMRIIRRHPKPFLGLTSILIMPMYIIGTLLAQPLLSQIRWDLLFQSETPQGRISADIYMRKVLPKFVPNFALYEFFIFAFTILSTVAIVYNTVRCIYAPDKIISSKKMILGVAPRACGRLAWTACCAILLTVTYILSFSIVFVIVATIFASIFGVREHAMIVVDVLGLGVGVIYANCVWELASVCSVVEGCCGLEALRNGHTLIKGRLGTALLLFFVRVALALPIRWVSKQIPDSFLSYIVFFAATMAFLDLISLVTRTFFYFSCKAYHHQPIDKLHWPPLLLEEHLTDGSLELHPNSNLLEP